MPLTKYEPVTHDKGTYLVVGYHTVYKIPAKSELEAATVASELRGQGFEVEIKQIIDLFPQQLLLLETNESHK